MMEIGNKSSQLQRNLAFSSCLPSAKLPACGSCKSRAFAYPFSMFAMSHGMAMKPFLQCDCGLQQVDAGTLT